MLQFSSARNTRHKTTKATTAPLRHEMKKKKYDCLLSRSRRVDIAYDFATFFSAFRLHSGWVWALSRKNHHSLSSSRIAELEREIWSPATEMATKTELTKGYDNLESVTKHRTTWAINHPELRSMEKWSSIFKLSYIQQMMMISQ